MSHRCPEVLALRNARIVTAEIKCETIPRYGSAATETGLQGKLLARLLLMGLVLVPRALVVWISVS